MSKKNEYLILLILSLSFIQPLYISNPLEIYEILVFIPLVLLAVIFRPVGKERKEYLIPNGMLIFGCFSVFQPSVISAKILFSIFILYFVWLIANYKYKLKDLRGIVIFIFVSLCYSNLIYFDLISFSIHKITTGSFTGVFLQENAMFLFLIFSMTFVALMYKNQALGKKTFFLTVGLILLSMIFARGSRIGVVSFLFGVGIFIIVRYLPVVKISKRVFILSLFLLTTFLLSNLIAFILKSSDISATSRKIIWEVAIKMGMENPIVGVGLGGFQYHWIEYLERVGGANPRGYNFQYESAHNFFLSAFSELGFLGFFMSVSIVIIPFFSLGYKAYHTRKFEFILLFSSLGSVILFISMTTVVWTQPFIRLIFVFYLGNVWFVSQFRVRSFKSLKLIKVLLFCTVIASFYFAYGYSRYLYSEYLLFENKSNGGMSSSQVVEVLNVNPLSGPANQMMVDMLQSINAYEEAEAQIGQLYRISGDIYNPKLKFARLYNIQGFFEKEEAVLLEYIQLYPIESFDERITLLINLAKQKKCHLFDKNNLEIIKVLKNVNWVRLNNWRYKRGRQGYNFKYLNNRLQDLSCSANN